MDIRQYLSGLALLAALATASGCNGLERRALADTSGAAPIVAAPRAASGSGEPENKPHTNGFFYDSQGRKVPPTPESIKAYEATLKTPDDELYRLIDSLDAKKAEEENQKGNYEFALSLHDKLQKIKAYQFGALSSDRRNSICLGFNEYCAAALGKKERKYHEYAADFIDEAIRSRYEKPAPWVNALVAHVLLGEKFTAKRYAEEYFELADENHSSYSKVRGWYDRNN